MSWAFGRSVGPAACGPPPFPRSQQDAFKELYRGLDLLRQYRNVNYSAVVVLLEAHDQESEYHLSAALLHRLQATPFSSARFLTRAMRHLLAQYVAIFGVSVEDANATLRIPQEPVPISEVYVQVPLLGPACVLSRSRSLCLSLLPPAPAWRLPHCCCDCGCCCCSC